MKKKQNSKLTVQAIIDNIVNQNIGGKITWFKNVNNILDHCYITNIWPNRTLTLNTKWLKAKIKTTLIDPFKQNWMSLLHVQNSTKALNY